jgi:hypothetical protein
MKIHPVEQGTLDWLRLHIGIPTASGLDQLVDSNFDLRKGEMPRTYVYTKLAEQWRGKPLVSLNTSTGSFSTEQGMILEDEGRPYFTLETGRKVKTVGFITTDDNTFGCSPDGLIIEEECGIEIKCPAAHTHVRWLVEGVVPKDYVAQVHASMFVTGYPQWVFMSYRRGFPPLILEVKRDEAIQAKIALAIKDFHKRLAEAREKMAAIKT